MNKRLICNISLEDISPIPTVKRFRKKESPALVSLFIKFKYFINPSEESTEQLHLTDSDRHRMYLCPVCRDSQSCGKTGYLRYSSISDHICSLLENIPVIGFGNSIVKQPDVPSLPAVKQRRVIPGVKTVVQNAMLELISATSISFSLVCSQQFKKFMQTLVSVGQLHPLHNLDSLVPYQDSHTFPQLIRKKLETNIRSLLSSLRNTTVSLMCDAGTVSHHHYIAITITECRERSPIFFFKIVSGPWTAEQYAQTLAKVIEQLLHFNSGVGTIVTDGLAAQSAGIHLLRGTIASLQHLNNEEMSFVPLHLPCYNHRINLALTDLFEQDALLDGIKQAVLSFSTDSDKANFQSLLKKHCPSFIKTRWLSLWFICSFVRLKRNIIIDAGWMPPDYIISVLKLEILLMPLMELHLLCESESTRFCYVFPALLRTFLQYLHLLRQPEYHSGEWLHSVVSVLVALFNRTCRHPSIYLAELAFAFTPLGRALNQRGLPLTGFRIDDSLRTVIAKLFVPTSCFAYSLFSNTDNDLLPDHSADTVLTATCMPFSADLHSYLPTVSSTPTVASNPEFSTAMVNNQHTNPYLASGQQEHSSTDFSTSSSSSSSSSSTPPTSSTQVTNQVTDIVDLITDRLASQEHEPADTDILSIIRHSLHPPAAAAVAARRSPNSFPEGERDSESNHEEHPLQLHLAIIHS